MASALSSWREILVLPSTVTLAGLAVYLYQGGKVSAARGQYGVKAPATTGTSLPPTVFKKNWKRKILHLHASEIDFSYSLISLLFFLFFLFLCTYIGHPVFERIFRAHQNTLESLVCYFFDIDSDCPSILFSFLERIRSSH